MQALLAFLGSATAKIFADKVLSWIALRTLLVFLFLTVVPLVLNNFLYDIIEICMNFANNQTGSAGTLNGGMTFSGVCGYFVSIFKIPESISVMVSALVLRVALSMIPLVRV
jgi:hypothetical protein